MKGLNRIPVSLVVPLVSIALLLACTPSAPSNPDTSPKGSAATGSQAASSSKATGAVSTQEAKVASKPLEKVRIMVPIKSAIFLEVFLAQDKGLFKEEGLDAEILVISGPLAIPALLKGEVDYTYLLGRTLDAALLGEPVRVLMAQTAKAAWHYIGGPGITTAQQIKGKPVAVGMIGAFDHYASMAAIKHLGLDPLKDVTYVTIPSIDDQLAALKAGSVLAAGLLPPASNKALELGFKELVFTGDIMELPSNGISTTSKRVQENRDQVKRVMKAALKGMAWGREHKDEAVQFVVKEFSVDKAIAEAVVADQIKVWAYDGSITDKGLETYVLSTREKEGPLKSRNITLEQAKQHIEWSLLKDVQREMGLVK